MAARPASADGGRDGSSECLPLLHVSASSDRNLGQAFDILGFESHHDIDILRTAHDPPSVDGQAAHHDELHVCGR